MKKDKPIRGQSLLVDNASENILVALMRSVEYSTTALYTRQAERRGARVDSATVGGT